MNKSVAWKMGYDAGLNGPNKVNCHYSIFENKDQTRDWEAGNAEGKKKKLEQEFEAVKRKVYDWNDKNPKSGK